jgi:hypothetical protein
MYLKTEGATTNGYVLVGDEVESEIEEFSVVATSNLLAGEYAETIEEIKNRAILFFTTQNRAVTKNDYYNLFGKYSKLSEFESYSIYGGETVFIDVSGYEVEYSSGEVWADTGYVYFSVLKKTDTPRLFGYLDEQEKNEIVEYFTPYKVLTMFFKFVDPVIVYVKPKIRLSLVSYVGVELNVLEKFIDDKITEIVNKLEL